ncbi:hypothetical protein [Rhodopila sp.]|uniref:hypothetical protein n=1 Tax=Rhodopila sp. TaxID=2480087 RepID=UPI003D0D624F
MRKRSASVVAVAGTPLTARMDGVAAIWSCSCGECSGWGGGGWASHGAAAEGEFIAGIAEAAQHRVLSGQRFDHVATTRATTGMKQPRGAWLMASALRSA